MAQNILIYPIRMKLPKDGNPSAASLPLMAAVVETAHDLVLVDSGFPHSSDLFDRLDLLHIAPEDISVIINTHVHADHIGNNNAFPQARIIASKVDYNYLRDYSHALINSQDPMTVVARFFPYSSSKRKIEIADHAAMMAKKYWRDNLIGPIHTIEWVEDRPYLPLGFQIVPTPGHTPGHISIVISGEKEKFIIAGDALPSRLFWKRRLQELAPRFSSAEFQKSKERIESMTGIIMGGHDLPFHTTTLNYIDKKRIIL